MTFSLQALFFQINLHFHSLKPLMGAAEHLGNISYCLGAEQGVSLLSLTASFSILALPTAVALL